MENKPDFFVLPGRRRGINISIGPDESVYVDGATSGTFHIPIKNHLGNPYLFTEPGAIISVTIRTSVDGKVDIFVGVNETDEQEDKIRKFPGIRVIPKEEQGKSVFDIIAHDGDVCSDFLIETLSFSAQKENLP